MALLLGVLLLLPSWQPTASAAQLLARVARVSASVAGSHSNLVISKLALGASLPALGRLKSNLDRSDPRYAAVSFCLAYYGVQYRQNVADTLGPYFFMKSPPARATTHGERVTAVRDLDYKSRLPFYLLLLWKRHHDFYPLAHMLDLRLDGAPAESQGVAILELWRKRPRQVLHLSCGRPVRIENVSEALIFEASPQSGSLRRARRVLSDLDNLAQSRDKCVRAAARVVSRRIIRAIPISGRRQLWMRH
jgi:hypothetical protein